MSSYHELPGRSAARCMSPVGNASSDDMPVETMSAIQCDANFSFVNSSDSLQDYCGLLSEEAVRKNFVLLYELLDEVIDYGYPQNSSSEALKEFILNEPTVLKSVSASCLASPQPTWKLLCWHDTRPSGTGMLLLWPCREWGSPAESVMEGPGRLCTSGSKASCS